MKANFWKYYWLVCIFVMLASHICIASDVVLVKDSLPAIWKGNWKNVATQKWEYGLFEHFAIYDTDFWEYKQIRSGKNKVAIVLVKNGQEVKLFFRRTRRGGIEIAKEKGKFVAYQSMDKGFSPYPEPDTSFFKRSCYLTDTVVLRGCFCHWDQLPENKRIKIIEVVKNDFLAAG